MNPKLLFLGTAAGCGVPSFFCTCVACQEARLEPQLTRSRCSVIIQGQSNTLIDTPPDLRTQLVRAGISQIDRLILTHWHYDHSGGLGELEFFTRMKSQKPIPTWMSQETYDWLSSAFWFMKDCLSVNLAIYETPVTLEDMILTPLRVQHAPGTLGLLIETPRGNRTAYLSDTGPLPAITTEQLQGVNTLILGAPFWKGNWMPEDHLSVDEAIQIGLALNAGQIYLTHLSMHYVQPVTNRELLAHVHQFGDHIHLAYDGLRIDI